MAGISKLTEPYIPNCEPTEIKTNFYSKTETKTRVTVILAGKTKIKNGITVSPAIPRPRMIRVGQKTKIHILLFFSGGYHC